MAIPFLQEAGYIPGEITPEKYEWLKLVITSVQEYLSYVAQVTDYTGIYFNDRVEFDNEETAAILEDPDVPGVMEAFREKISGIEEITPENTKVMLKALTKELKLGGKKVYMPLRVALTGSCHGPELDYIIPVLGRDGVLHRLAQTVQVRD